MALFISIYIYQVTFPIIFINGFNYKLYSFAIIWGLSKDRYNQQIEISVTDIMLIRCD